MIPLGPILAAVAALWAVVTLVAVACPPRCCCPESGGDERLCGAHGPIESTP